MNTFKLLLILLLACQSCSTVYRNTGFTDDGNYKETSTKITTNSSSCKREEMTIIRDKQTKVVLSKEIIVFDCKGAYAAETSRQRWILQDGKLILQK